MGLVLRHRFENRLSKRKKRKLKAELPICEGGGSSDQTHTHRSMENARKKEDNPLWEMRIPQARADWSSGGGAAVIPSVS